MSHPQTCKSKAKKQWKPKIISFDSFRRHLLPFDNDCSDQSWPRTIRTIFFHPSHRTLILFYMISNNNQLSTINHLQTSGENINFNSYSSTDRFIHYSCFFFRSFLSFRAADIQPNSFRFVSDDENFIFKTMKKTLSFQFLDDSLTVAAAYLGGTWRLPIQIGALYTIFTIYMYQLEEPKIKVKKSIENDASSSLFFLSFVQIRLTLETCKSFLDQMESSNDVPADAKTILCKLLDEHAFVLSATRHEVCSSRFFFRLFSLCFQQFVQMGPRFFTKINYMKSGKYMRSDVLLSSRMTVDEKLVQVKLKLNIRVFDSFRFSCVKKRIICTAKQKKVLLKLMVVLINYQLN